MKKKKVFQITFETVFDKPSAKENCLFSWAFTKNRYAYVAVESIEEAISFTRQNFAALTSKLEFEENERPVDIKEVSLYKDEVYA